MEDTSLESERFLVSQWAQTTPQRVQRQLTGAWNFWVSSPEDMVLIKLEWFRDGRQLSDRQWRDVLAILAARRGQLSFDYLHHWAGELQVQDLLQQALEQVRPL